MKHLEFLKGLYQLRCLFMVSAALCVFWVLIASFIPSVTSSLATRQNPLPLQSQQAQLEPRKTPTATDKWYPSKYGAADKVGVANVLTPELVKKAVGLVTEGKVYALGLEINENTPGFSVHQILLAKNGIYILENINTSVLVEADVHEFLFVLGQPRFTGAT